MGTSLNFLRFAAGIGLGTKIKYLRRSASGATGYGLGTTITYLRGAAVIGLGAAIKNQRRTTSAAAGSGLGFKAKYLVNQNADLGKNQAKAHKTKSAREFC